MTEEQKKWEISVKMSYKDCKLRKHIPDIEDGKYQNFGEYRCQHPKAFGMLCASTNKGMCPLLWELDYPLNPSRQVNKDDV